MKARAFGVEALPLECHVGYWDQVEALADAACQRFGDIDILVNNAGMAPLYPSIREISEALYDKVMDVNLKGTFRLTAVVGDRMKARGSGSIIFVSSSAATKPTPGEVVYGMAKASLHNLTESLSKAYGPEVRVNCIQPGPFLTDISKAWSPEAIAGLGNVISLGRAGRPEEIVGAAPLLRQRRRCFYHRRNPAPRRRYALTLSDLRLWPRSLSMKPRRRPHSGLSTTTVPKRRGRPQRRANAPTVQSAGSITANGSKEYQSMALRWVMRLTSSSGTPTNTSANSSGALGQLESEWGIIHFPTNVVDADLMAQSHTNRVGDETGEEIAAEHFAGQHVAEILTSPKMVHVVGLVGPVHEIGNPAGTSLGKGDLEFRVAAGQR